MLRLITMMFLLGAAATPMFSQASAMPSASPTAQTNETDEQQGKRLLAEMVKALGGDKWLNSTSEYLEGSTAAFFRNRPNGSVVRFVEYIRPANSADGPAERYEYLTARGVIMPGTKRDVAHLWTKDHGYEVTYKGRTELPAKQVDDYLRRRAHSLDTVMRTWVNAPGVVILGAGTGMRDRHLVEKVDILMTDNDSVEIEIDVDTHLPLQRSFEWRNDQFKDHDIDEESYTDYQVFDGVETPMNITRYRNGDMVSQIFLTKVHYNEPMDAKLFDPDKLLKKK